MKQVKIIPILIGLVVLSIIISYAHRFLVADRKLNDNLPVITDTVIPAIVPTGEKAATL